MKSNVAHRTNYVKYLIGLFVFLFFYQERPRQRRQQQQYKQGQVEGRSVLVMANGRLDRVLEVGAW